MVGHSVAHYFNYAHAPYYAQALGPLVFSPSPTHMAWSAATPGSPPLLPSRGLTGQLLALIMMVIYAGAHDTVRRTHYETFWYTHHLFAPWLLLLLLHAPVWWQWAALPLLAYSIDRLVIRIALRCHSAPRWNPPCQDVP